MASPSHSIVSVFGSSSPAPDEPVYRLAVEAGRRLAEAGFAVQTGGYSGTMAGASQGAAEAGGHVIGVTSDAIEGFRPARPNPWIVEEVRHATLRERLRYLIDSCHGVLVLPGGVGTLTELALTWNMVMVGETPPRPIVCLGGRWAATLEAFLDPEHVTAEHTDLVAVAEDPDAAVAHLAARVPLRKART